VAGRRDSTRPHNQAASNCPSVSLLRTHRGGSVGPALTSLPVARRHGSANFFLGGPITDPATDVASFSPHSMAHSLQMGYHNCLFSVWHDGQLRLHQRSTDSDREQLPNSLVGQHQQLKWRNTIYHISDGSPQHQRTSYGSDMTFTA